MIRLPPPFPLSPQPLSQSFRLPPSINVPSTLCTPVDLGDLGHQGGVTREMLGTRRCAVVQSTDQDPQHFARAADILL
eukprot:m.50818 g.50818  ORF g.50818 m.50818 type:complete len:78 (-) comp9028_c0_seq2:2463-2696(-)